MNNEPVAWMETYKGEPNNLDWDKSNLNYGSEFHDVVPLYTHPAEHDLGIAEAIGFEKGHKSAEDMLRQQQAEIEGLINANRFIQNFAEEQHQRAVALEMRELTDEEIVDIGTEFLAPKDCDIYTFARAILRKAQEK